MYIRDWMSRNVIWIESNASIQKALGLMKSHGIRHLPVRDKEGRFVGWITDSDVRGVLIASMLEDLTVADVMIHNPYTVSPDEHLEDAARLMILKKIGGVPVVEYRDGEPVVVGVLTVVDVLRAFMEMFGGLARTERIDVSGTPELLKNLTPLVEAVQKAGGSIQSVCAFVPEAPNEDPVISIHVRKGAVSNILEELGRLGIKVKE
ncbi:CBS domain-containing protein [Thermodesulforhabdus norvegica]|uniref:Acetoin utilization protein AcuB n=1 Tax=Thermodesulforhabdus norvegica TaxID=39841 RepID=A0A1I4UQU1_9BACT|nr:CBS domain-containing protein [Thermodesulforhabdus norvegica]SFM91083.1 acetoin utilization protein AcuB [Thermodesulforhabdus norvegica]